MSAARDFAGIARDYAERVVQGVTPACKWTVAACLRQLDDLARAEAEGFPYRYEPGRGEKVCKLLELMPHIKGRWKSRTIVLEPWQIFNQMTLFSWVCTDPERAGRRRFRTDYEEVPRKNAKSTISAGRALYMLGPDNELGAEVYCLAPETRVLSAGFKWVPVGSLRMGEALIAFDEYPPAKRAFRKLRRATVTSADRVVLPAYRITLDDGRGVIASGDHMWLAQTTQRGDRRGWIRTSRLRAGARIRDLGPPWQDIESREAGYLAGVFDGEACFHQAKNREEGARDGFRIAFAQNPGIVMDYVRRLCEEFGFQISANRQHQDHASQTFEIPGFYNCARFLGQVRPLRLLDRALKWCEGRTPNRGNNRIATVIDVRPLGPRELVAIGTSTRTLFAEGLFSHNSAATTRDQAKIVLDVARAMARKTPQYLQAFGAEVLANQVLVEDTDSFLRALSADYDSLDGANPHFASVDELHAHKSRGVWDVLETATGAREQSLLSSITTAGGNRAGICYEVRGYLCQILTAVLKRHPALCDARGYKVDGASVDDETLFGIIFTIDDGDDWADEASWAKANPNLGISVKLDDLRRKCRKALQMPSAQPNFLTKHLNVWLNADSAWMDMRRWDACADPTLSIEHFLGESCFISADLASNIDIAATVALFTRLVEETITDKESGDESVQLKEHYYAFGRFYLPDEAIEDSDNAQYAGWELTGRLLTTPGAVIDQNLIQDDIREAKSKHQVRELVYDPFQATKFATELASEGFTTVEYGATVANFSAPMKKLEEAVFAGRFHFDGDPVLTWMVSNVVAHVDKKDNVFPNKPNATAKIDGAVALIMALGRAMHAPPPPAPPSISVIADEPELDHEDFEE